MTPLYSVGESVRYKGSIWQVDYASFEEGTYLISGGDWASLEMIPPLGVTGDLAISVSVEVGNTEFVRV